MGNARIVNIWFGLIRNILLGRNSAVSSTISVARIVCRRNTILWLFKNSGKLAVRKGLRRLAI
jgi:hypothetical protein